MACCRRAGWCVGEESDDYGICLLDEEAAKLIQPDLFSGMVWRMSQLSRKLSCYGDCGGGVVWVCKGVVECFEVLGQLEGRVDVHELGERWALSHVL